MNRESDNSELSETERKKREKRERQADRQTHANDIFIIFSFNTKLLEENHLLWIQEIRFY